MVYFRLIFFLEIKVNLFIFSVCYIGIVCLYENYNIGLKVFFVNKVFMCI